MGLRKQDGVCHVFCDTHGCHEFCALYTFPVYKRGDSYALPHAWGKEVARNTQGNLQEFYYCPGCSRRMGL